MDNRPIGVFDSGLGGLTVVRELIDILPHEDIVYFGDTGRVPYGTRSRETIKRYAQEDEAFLLSQNVKLIIAACGTVSSVAPETGDNLPVPFLGVVDPAAKAAATATKNGKIGVIGTPATIASGAYKKALYKYNNNLEIISVECPLFVPLVEAGWISPDDEVTILTARRYLDKIKQMDVDTLILGCTHYPLISEIISNEMGSEVTLISAGQAAAKESAKLLSEKGLCTDKLTEGQCSYFVTDRPEGFQKTAGLFLQKEISDSVVRINI